MLEISHLTKSYRTGLLQSSTRPAVQDFSLSIRRGDSVGLAGSSGSGKTTVSRMILHLEKPDAGNILFEGQDIRNLHGAQLRAYRRKVQIIYQNPTASLNPAKKLHKSIIEPLEIHQLYTKQERENRLQRLIQQVGIHPSLLERYPHQISGGEAQRAMIARALILEPELIILDEPTSMLDVSVQAQILHLLKELQETCKLTYLMISHDPGVLEWFCSSLTVLHQGITVEQGATADIFSEPRSEVARTLLGCSIQETE